MHIILAIASALFFAVGVIALAVSKSDLQIGIAVTAFAAGFILFGLAGIAARLDDIWRGKRGRPRPRLGEVVSEEDR